ncbi:MAG: hypothetical protein PVH63_13830 [Balneolaceae bacterium]|jgi:hypothetical protein
MSDNLDDLMDDFDELSDKAENEADAKAAHKISGVTRMSMDEIRQLFPKHRDQRKLEELMEIVKSADDHNTKINKIVKRAEEFGGIVVKLLNTL